MKPTHRASSRALITVASVGAAMSTALLFGAGQASAHVHVHAEGGNPAPGSTTILTFQVPGESETGALTTQLTVALPNVASARAEVMPGWTARLDRDAAAGTVRSITWTATPPVGISSDQFALFNVEVTLPNQPSVTLPATQTYSDGTVVHWDQPPLANGDEPEHPVPALTLSGKSTGGDGDDDDHQMPPQPVASVTAAPAAAPAAAAPSEAAPSAAAPDDTARWLAGGALVLGAVAVVTALAGRRRTVASAPGSSPTDSESS